MRTGIAHVDARIEAALAAAAERFGPGAVARIARARLTRFEPCEAPPLQRPSWLYMPDLPTRPYWTRGACGRLDAVVDALEAAHSALRAEIAAIPADTGEVYDHLSVAPGAAPGWKHWFFYRDHVANPALLDRVPTLRRVVERFDHAHLDAFEIHLSVLEPGGFIPPHCGGANAKLTIHLPLRIPAGDTALRVAGEARGWREGEVLVFDDSFEHEAWNRTAHPRAVLLFTAYHPDLSAEEVEVMRMLEPLNVEVYRAALRAAGTPAESGSAAAT